MERLLCQSWPVLGSPVSQDDGCARMHARSSALLHAFKESNDVLIEAVAHGHSCQGFQHNCFQGTHYPNMSITSCVSNAYS